MSKLSHASESECLTLRQALETDPWNSKRCMQFPRTFLLPDARTAFVLAVNVSCPHCANSRAQGSPQPDQSISVNEGHEDKAPLRQTRSEGPSGGTRSTGAWQTAVIVSQNS